ncbi:unnamed protein product, partial [Urochloa humidicola]
RTAPSSFSLRRARVLAAGQSGPARWISPRPVLDRVPLLRPPCLAARSVSRAPLAPTADEARRINLVLATLPRHLRRRCEATDHNPVALASLYRRPPDPPPPPPVRVSSPVVFMSNAHDLRFGSMYSIWIPLPLAGCCYEVSSKRSTGSISLDREGLVGTCFISAASVVAVACIGGIPVQTRSD